MSGVQAGLNAGWVGPEDAREAGRALREKVSLAEHASFTLPVARPKIEEFLAVRNAHRLTELLPIGHGRMSVNAFAFYRGSAGLMAHDLAYDPVTGLHGQICGDAHAANFGLYGTHDGRIVMDINDFDDSILGPWEWDLKRLATSLVLAGRTGIKIGDKAGRKTARDAARAYRAAMTHLAALAFVDSWTALGDESAIEHAEADELFDDFAVAARKAAANTSEKAAGKIAHRHDHGDWHFVPQPPVLTTVDESTKAAVISGLADYVGTLRRSWQPLARRYRPWDVAMRIVGTGSVGMRVYVVLMQGNGTEALILQVKQAGPSALAPYLPADPERHDGARIVRAARLVQAETDPFFGWTMIEDRPFIVRQFRNRKGSIDPILLTKNHLDDYGRLAGALLARAHSRSIDPRVLAAYLEDGTEFDEAIAEFAHAYASQVERDHAEFAGLITRGGLAAVVES